MRAFRWIAAEEEDFANDQSSLPPRHTRDAASRRARRGFSPKSQPKN
jgi:hypothetical protein